MCVCAFVFVCVFVCVCVREKRELRRGRGVVSSEMMMLNHEMSALSGERTLLKRFSNIQHIQFIENYLKLY